MNHLKHRNNTTRALFRGTQPDESPEFLPEEEQEELIESLRISNEKANLFFKTILIAFSVLEIATLVTFVIYWQIKKTLPLADNNDDYIVFRSVSPMTAVLFSLLSFGIGITLIRDSSLIQRKSIAIWTVVSLVPLFLMIGVSEISLEFVWWSMPLLLQFVDLASLWVMKEPDEEFFQLEKSQYKLKGA